MKKYLLSAVAVMMACMASSAQYFSTTVGQELTYKSTDTETKSEKTAKATVLSVDTNADGVITMREENVVTDAENPLLEVKMHRTYTYDPKTGVTKVVMMSADDFKEFVLSMIRQAAQAAGQYVSDMEYSDLANAISAKGSLEFDIDPTMAPDTKLPKSSLRLNAGAVSMRGNLWDVKMLGTETVTVPAGTYEDCVKIAYTMVMNSPDGNSKQISEDWFAKGVGLVKSVEYDKKGNVTSIDELTSVK